MTIQFPNPREEGAQEALAATVARRTRGVLAELGMTQQALGASLGISNSAMSKRLRGQMEFSLGELPIVADQLGVSMEYLLGFTNDRSPRRATAGGGSMFVLPERTSGLSAALRACRDSNPKPSDLWPAIRRFVALLGHLVIGRDRSVSEPLVVGDRGGSGAVIIGFPFDRMAHLDDEDLGEVLDRIQAGELPDDYEPDPPAPAGRQRRHLRSVS